MKILVIIASSYLSNRRFLSNIEILKKMSIELPSDFTVEYAAISNFNDFELYDELLNFKYKIIDTNKQLSKLCSFISSCQEKYDWYIKFRPEIELIDNPFVFNNYCKYSINARLRSYKGPRIIEYGSSIGGEGCWKEHGIDIEYSDIESRLILDDIIYIFHRNVIDIGGFSELSDEYTEKRQDEWLHTEVWKSRLISLNPIRLYLKLLRDDVYAYSGNVNIGMKSTTETLEIRIPQNSQTVVQPVHINNVCLLKFIKVINKIY